MDKGTFIRILKEGTKDQKTKIEVCQFFVDNYPVKINSFPQGEWSSLNIKINGGSKKAINHAFKRLQGRVQELNKFEIVS
jgi:hypothetical protein